MTSDEDIAPDALSVLRRDHRLAEELFAEFARSAPQQLDPLARRICKMLRVHTQIEEELFYPVVGRALTAEKTLLEDARREHQQAKESIVRIESMTSDAAGFRDEVAQLARQVAEHVAMEEQELFPQVQTTVIDLAALGVALAERRDTLLDVLGLHHDDEEGAANQRETHPQEPRVSERPAQS
ncbi:MAG TPA: hemerythrin domain-containing protein [Steroidobacteraceae bacterium]|nr:hemerythrin domain-containing protein [Steroidobacteraceae bacterium]